MYDGSAALPISGVVRKGPLVARKKVAQSTLPIDPDPAAGKDAADEADYRPAIQGEIVEVAVGSLTAHPLNADIYRDDADEELVASVREHGVTTPIEITAAYVVISGHRRLSAARQAGLETVPAFVRSYPTDEASVTAMVRANLYRRKTKDQRDREIEALRRSGMSVRAIQETTGVSKSQVAVIASGVRNRTPGPVGPTKGLDGRSYPARVTKPSRRTQSGTPAAYASPDGSPDAAPPIQVRDTGTGQDRPEMDAPASRMPVALAFDLAAADAVPDVPGPWRNRIVGHGSRSPQALVPNPYGRGKPLDLELALAGQSLASIGWFLPVIVNQVTGHIIDGHSRVTMAITRGELLVPVMYLDLSIEEERRVRDFFDGTANDRWHAPEATGALATGEPPPARLSDDPGNGDGDQPVDEGVPPGNVVG